MGRPKYQKGSLVKRRGMWVLRYYEDRLEDGATKRVRVSKNLGLVSEFPKDSDGESLRDKALARTSINSAGDIADASLTLDQFINQRYWPRLEWRLQQPGDFHIEPATIKGYKDIYRYHVKESKVANIRLRDFHTADGQAFLESLPPQLSHRTHLRIKAFMSGVFSFAKQSKVLEGVNPMDDTKAGGKSKTSFKAHAYTFAELKVMFKVLPEPAKTVCAVAAFTGLGASELRGLRWQDYDGASIHVRQKVWRKHVGPPKTKAREGSVPVIPLLRDILAKYKKLFPPTAQDFIFAGDKKGFALSLDNLSRRVISPLLKAEKDSGWHGWHSFRRGLATRLYALGETDLNVQTIMRHANVSVTQAYYIIPDAESREKTMGKFGEETKRVLGSFWTQPKSRNS